MASSQEETTPIPRIKKTKYSQLSDEQKKSYIQRSVDNKRKQHCNESSGNTINDKRQRKVDLFYGSLLLDFEHEGNKRGILFIDGPGGTGKTFLYRALLAKVRSEGMIDLATATSGMAPVIILGGRTIHFIFKIKISTTKSSMCSISKQDGTSKMIKIAKLIIWDEAPMAKLVAIEILDRTLRDIMDQDEPFGGKVIVFGGDFRQVLPVVPRAIRSQTIRESLVSSYLWSKMEKLKLSKNMRAITDSTFSEFLLRVGNGNEPTVADDLIALPTSILIKNQSDDLPEDCLINAIFPSLDENFKFIDYMKDRAILATKNEYVDMLNDRIIKQFPGEEK
ncbi:ATP-dependent DNA helicase PIF1-like [Asparagus officinalis]|uniref:ATP-dependent DNA helicase PIF1-like n=1 Tax=Asparagus officinalis TaxID=4686 RepID=UPI00098E4AD6|nr:ATP-dependent DNA helicase PIF1-like [Asparagus officinalis]